jgi:hypothetical protein
VLTKKPDNPPVGCPTADTSGMRMSGFLRHLWWIYLVLASVAAAAYVLTPFNAATRWVYVLLNCIAPIATWIGLKRNAPKRRLGWQIIVLGLALSGLGDVVFASYTARGAAAPFPSVAEMLTASSAVSA